MSRSLSINVISAVCLCLVTVMLLFSKPLQAQTSTIYELRFEATWSSATHPMSFPGNPHFSGLIGATHNDAVSFWNEGGLASPGIKSMAETGSKTALRGEFFTALNAGNVKRFIDQGGISRSPDSIVFSFRVDESHPLLTVVSMLAPSPDWFIGVSGLPLRDGTGWIDQISIDLFTWDAGTDSGTNYTSANQATTPAVPVIRLLDVPMLVQGVVQPIGKFIIQHTPVLSTEEVPVNAGTPIFTSIYPNPITRSTTVELELIKPENVSVDVFDLQGRRLASLYNGFLAAGTHSIPWTPESVSSGVYVVRLRAGNTISTSRLIVKQ
jgi:Spondin_N/Secretion system C-terminal sorting domain